MFDHEVLQHLDGYLANVPELLQSGADLSEQQPDQEVVLTEVVRQRIVHMEVCEAGRARGGC